jgi:Flp pilus assembly protein TadD
MQLAIAPLERAAEIDSDVHDTWHDLGVARISVGQATGDVALIKAAHEPLKRACDLDPTNIASWSALGGLYAMFNIQSGVEQVFQGLLRLNVPAAMQFRDNVASMLASRP